MQALLTNVLQRHWVWPEDRPEAWVLGAIWYKTAYVASHDVKTAFDVAKPSAGVLGRDEGRERVRVHRELRDVVQVFNMYQAAFVFWRAEEKWNRRGWGISFGGTYDEETLLGGMMWVDIEWFSVTIGEGW